jgi:prefoldin subunit 5
MSQADLKMQNHDSFPDLNSAKGASSPAPRQATPPPEPAGFPDMSSVLTTNASNDEAIEALIDEKWTVFEESVKKILTWKSTTELSVGKLEDRMKALEDQLKTLQEGIYGKIGEYDKHIQHIGTELKAVDKVFQKVLPALADNVAELGNITKNLKKS